MKRSLLLLCFFIVPIVSWGQGGSVALRKGLEALADPAVLRNSVSDALQRRTALELRSYFLPGSLVPTPREQIIWKSGLSILQTREAYGLYLRALKATSTLNRLLNTKLFYQGQQSTPLCELEITRDTHFIEITKNAIERASAFVSLRDPSLLRAQKYVDHVSRFYTMCSTGQILSAVDYDADLAGKEFNPQEFFLQTPPDLHETKQGLFQQIFGRKSRADNFPQTLRVAAVMEPFVWEEFSRFQRKKKLVGWTVKHFESPEVFLNDSEHLYYDLVLTDILIKGGGGEYLSRSLRAQGFTGSILATTAYTEEKEYGQKFLACGMDGMVSLTSDLKSSISTIFSEKLNNFFYYQAQRAKEKGEQK